MSKHTIYNNEIISKIVGIQFSMLSPDEIRKGSVAEITSRDTYINNKPVIGGLFDPRMGVLEPGLICPTDGLEYMQTPGYSGHIELARPVFYIQYLNTIQKVLKCVCFKCSKLLISKTTYKEALKMPSDVRFDYVFSVASKVKRCGKDTDDGCGNRQPTKIKKEGLANIYAEWKNPKSETIVVKFTPEIVLKIFKRITDEDVSFMGFSPLYSRPDWMICQVMQVSPPAVRPSVKHDSQQRSEDDLTHILVNIIKTNKTLQEKIQNNAPANVIDDWTTVLQYYIATQVDNKIPGVASVAQRSGRPFKSIKDRLNGKTGRMRGNLMAKRVDFSARSVITADPNISICELGVPMKIAKNITKPVYVNKINRDFLTKLVRNGPEVWPGAKMLQKKNGESITLKYYLDRNSIVLEEGDIVHRHMMNGDAILFNRQPTLHRMSMMCHIVRIMKRGDTFRMNVADTKPYNADFDGDEMNLHMPQDLEAETELKNLAAVPYQIISPANNASIIGIYQDSMLGSFLFSKEGLKFTPRHTMNLLMMFNGINENLLLQDLEKGVATNYDILSQIMPPLSIKGKIEIKNGKYIKGQMDKGVLGGRSKGLLQRICNDFGNMRSAKFIDDLQNIVTEYMKSAGFSVGISDLISNQSTNDEIVKVITNKKTEVKNLIDQVQLGTFENNTGKTNEEEFETQVNSILNQATSEAGKIGLKNLSQGNRFVTMVQAGSKGSDLNISFMISCLGQQNVDGKRIPYGFEHRTLPHFTKYDDSPGARGFVENSYINGLTPQELFMHAMGGRIGLIDTAVKTSTTGYIQRRLIKALEDLKIEYDMTIRTNKNKIVQFRYGDDGIDTTKVEDQEIPIVEMSRQDIYNHFLIPEESSKVKILSNIFLKNVITRLKKQYTDYSIEINLLISKMITKRDEIVKNVFKNKSEKIVNCPVAFNYIIHNIQGQCGITSSSLVDITLFEAYTLIKNYYERLKKIYYSQPTELFEILYFYYLSPKELLIIKRFNKNSLILLLDTIILNYKRAIVSPGEMVGIIAGQSIGEVSTQMSVPYETLHKILIVNKRTGKTKCETIMAGDFCDKLIKENFKFTFATGHYDSCETILEKLDEEYYIQSVSENQRTKWCKLSHISRHPVNGNLMRIKTKSGRFVETTLSHNHLILKDNKIVPIKGSDMFKGMKIPVCKSIQLDEKFIQNQIVLKDGTNILLDESFGIFVGSYLSKLYKQLYKNIPYKHANHSNNIYIMLSKTSEKCCKIPDFVFNAPKSFKKSVLQSYFKYETYKKENYINTYSTKNQQLIKDLCLLLNSFNIFASIKTEFTIKNEEKFYLQISQEYMNEYLENISIDIDENQNPNTKPIPNEINEYDVVWDEIVDIDYYKPNQKNYVYDFTVPGYETFMTDYGIFVHNTLNTFHFAGVASKSNVTRGVPRIEEILSLSSEIKNPSLSVYLKPEDERSKDRARTIMCMLEHTRLESIVKSSEICFDPDDLNTLIDEDKDCIQQYKAFENIINECNETEITNEDNDKSKWIIRLVMDPEAMLDKNITMDDVNFTLKNCYDDVISCIYSDFNSNKLIFRIRMKNVFKRNSQKKTKIHALDESDHIYILKNFQDQLLQKVVLRGVEGINKVILRKILDNVEEINGIYKKQDIWVLDTIGTNLLDVLGLDYIDNTRTQSNDIIEIYNILGIEAARQSIYNELVEVVEFDGTYINYHNYSVLVDRMTFSDKLISICRHGINNDNIGPIAKASFEETPKMFLKAAIHAELDTLRGISANVMVGQEGHFGTSAFQVLLDIEEMKKLEASSEYKYIDTNEEIEKFFGNVDVNEDKCGPNKISIQNNVITIKGINLGNDNDYEPGF